LRSIIGLPLLFGAAGVLVYGASAIVPESMMPFTTVALVIVLMPGPPKAKPACASVMC
jgi:hypothetical protein